LTEITQERLHYLFNYDPETGLFTNLVTRSSRTQKGMVAGYSRKDGHILIKIKGKNYLLHRLAYVWMMGSFPVEEIDHRDGDPSNNRWDNIRPATKSENQHNKASYKNSKTGVKGVSPCGSGYQAQIRINWKNIYLGIFPTIEEAKAVYDKAAIELHGEFARV
jgi:hypothetical protein